ncbi:MAG: hypothetical protein WCP92_07130 [bacterium]
MGVIKGYEQTTAASVQPDYHILNGTSVRPQSSKRCRTSTFA